MSVSLNVRQAYSEVDAFLEILTQEERNKIPQKLRNIFRQEKDNDYNKVIDARVPIIEQNLKEETLSIIALLNLQYWCNDENEKERLKSIYSENERKYQEELKEKYNPDNIFNNRRTDNVVNTVAMVEYKEPFFTKLINKIKRFFTR